MTWGRKSWESVERQLCQRLGTEETNGVPRRIWGIGLQEKVNGHTYFLHDGRARNLTEAIMWHGGEGEVSKNLFKQMSKEEREAVIAFLNSL